MKDTRYSTAALWQMANHHSIANGNGKSLSTERIL